MRFKYRAIGFLILLLVIAVFTILGMILDIKIITMYDVNPYVSFTFVFLCVGALVSGVVGIRTARRLTKGDEEKDQWRA